MSTPRRHALLVLCATIFATLATASLSAGPLTPPGGAITSTQKTLQDSEPRTPLNATSTPGDVSNLFIITQPGSYYLTADAKPTGNRNAILVNADNVTIDLRGFSLDGSQDPTGFRAGITCSTPRRNVVVRNGTIRSFRGYGIIGTFNTSNFEDLALIDTLGGQLEIAPSSGCIVRNVRTRAASGETGIQLGTNSVIENCTVEGGTVGITLTSGVVRGCSVLNPGFNGISINNGVVVHCTVEGANNTSSSTNAGINAGSGTHIESCTLRNCASAGITVSGGRSEVIGCEFYNCAKGINSINGRLRVEGCNFVQSSTVAITITGTGNLVVGNRFSANTANITAPAGNTIGEILDFSAGGTLTAANSHALANIIY